MREGLEGSLRLQSRSSLSTGSISWIVPAQIERGDFLGGVRKLDAVARATSPQSEVLIVGPSDPDSWERLRLELSPLVSVRLVDHPRHSGSGAAFQLGLSAAKCQFVLFADTSMNFHSEDLECALAAIHESDAVCCCRDQRRGDLLRRTGSGVYTQLVRSLFSLGVRDFSFPLNLFRRSSLEGLSIYSGGTVIRAEILCKLRRRGASIVEVDVPDRSEVPTGPAPSPADMASVLGGLLRIWWSDWLFPVMDRPADVPRPQSLIGRATQERRLARSESTRSAEQAS